MLHGLQTGMGPGVVYCKRKIAFFSGLTLEIQLRTQFPSGNPPIRVDQLIETLLDLWCDSCAWLSETWLIFHVAVATAETFSSLLNIFVKFVLN
jgi:hypothetical protein